jgi:cytoskeletal protein CcmA (bactofilin family)
MNRFARNFIFLLCASFGLAGLNAAATSIATAKTDAGNIYLKGDEIRITEPVAADLFAAGRRIVIEQSVGSDGAIAGGKINIKADIGQDLRIAGGEINVDSRIAGDLVAAGKTVTLGKSSTVGGSTLIAGRDVDINGKLAHGAKIYAENISVSGKIDGNTRLYAREITFSPDAKIDGDLTYASTNPLASEQITHVTGKVIREKAPEGWRSSSWEATFPVTWFHPVFFLSMLICGSLLYILFPNAVAGTRQTIKSYPLRSLLIGLVLLFMLPPMAVLFMVSLIGLPIGLGLMAFYPLLLILGYLAAAFFIGGETANVLKQPKDFTTGRQIVFLAIALLILAGIFMIPLLGGLVVFLALVTGIGAWAVWLHQRYRHDRIRSTDSIEI